jgi:predicted flap endonuclease-1-like 5' DNA nuclease
MTTPLPKPTNNSETYLVAILDEVRSLRAELTDVRTRTSVPAAAAGVVMREPVRPAAPADFTALHGVGPKRNQELHEKGFRSWADLADASAELLRATMEVSAEVIAEWQAEARKRL